jgi:hypothetical protein
VAEESSKRRVRRHKSPEREREGGRRRRSAEREKNAGKLASALDQLETNHAAHEGEANRYVRRLSRAELEQMVAKAAENADRNTSSFGCGYSAISPQYSTISSSADDASPVPKYGGAAQARPTYLAQPVQPGVQRHGALVRRASTGMLGAAGMPARPGAPWMDAQSPEISRESAGRIFAKMHT